MKFKDWFLELNPDLIAANPFKCIGWCEKFFFYVDEDCPVEKLIEDIKNGWGPANFDIVEIDFYEDMWVITCNDGKCDVTTEQCKEMMKKSLNNMKEYPLISMEEYYKSRKPSIPTDEEKEIDKLTKEFVDMLCEMTDKEIDTLYEALLHIDEVGMLGDGALLKLFKAV